MGRGAIIAVFAGFLGLGTLAGAPWGGAIQTACAAGDRRVPYPDIPRGKGERFFVELPAQEVYDIVPLQAAAR
ncbi:MAG: hypothetical protein IIB88_10455 [Chloroflexi bacterium]|nr:hypothetical protein [Chloroflexota bacterium]